MEFSGYKYKCSNRLFSVSIMVRKHTIKCSACDKTFSSGFDYRMHWEELHLDYAMEQIKIKNNEGKHTS